MKYRLFISCRRQDKGFPRRGMLTQKPVDIAFLSQQVEADLL